MVVAVSGTPSLAEPDSTIAFVLSLARALHRYGTPAHRLEEALRRVCERLGIDAEVFTTPTAIIMSFGDPTHLRTRMMRVDGGELDMSKLARVDALTDDVVAKRVTVAEGVSRLDAIVSSPRQFGRVLSTLVHGTTAGSIAVFFGGSVADVALASAIGLTLGVLAQVIKRSTDQARVLELIGAAFAAFVSGVASAFRPDIAPSLVTVASLVILLPGMSLTVAMTELATRNMIAGTARLMSAVLVLLELVVGVALGEHLAAAVVDVHVIVPVPLPEASHWVAVLAASLGLAIVVQAQPRAFGWIVAASVIGYAGSRLGGAWLGSQMGVLVGAFALGITSNAYARWLDRPAQVVQVPAVLLLVPGSMGFRGMSSLLDKDTLSGVETLFAMFVVAIAIVAGLLVANAVVSPRRSL
jgi:uncharacterized membrane protein YjjP (DUF1212 family)